MVPQAETRGTEVAVAVGAVRLHHLPVAVVVAAVGGEVSAVLFNYITNNLKYAWLNYWKIVF